MFLHVASFSLTTRVTQAYGTTIPVERENEMTRRTGDKTPEPPGGRAAERLRMFEEARRPKEASPDRKEKKAGKERRREAPPPAKKGKQPR
jgi:hypothetical protein